MRTTLTIDDDVLQAAKELAEHRNTTIGQVISELARKALTPAAQPRRYRNGVPLLPVQPGARIATLELVNQLRDEFP